MTYGEMTKKEKGRREKDNSGTGSLIDSFILPCDRNRLLADLGNSTK